MKFYEIRTAARINEEAARQAWRENNVIHINNEMLVSELLSVEEIPL